jgi:hypothetical protein
LRNVIPVGIRRDVFRRVRQARGVTSVTVGTLTGAGQDT